MLLKVYLDPIGAATHDELIRMCENYLEVQGGHFEHFLK